jgi:hypothetical protein
LKITSKLATITAEGTAYGINVSKQFGPGAFQFTPYAGYLVEKAKMTFDYEYTFNQPATGVPTTVKQSLVLDGENTSRITLGANIRLGFVNIYGDYNIGNKFKSITAGLSIAI